MSGRRESARTVTWLMLAASTAGCQLIAGLGDAHIEGEGGASPGAGGAMSASSGGGQGPVTTGPSTGTHHPTTSSSSSSAGATGGGGAATGGGASTGAGAGAVSTAVGTGGAAESTSVGVGGAGGACPSGQADCGFGCVDTTTNHAHCGSSCNACAAAEACENAACAAVAPQHAVVGTVFGDDGGDVVISAVSIDSNHVNFAGATTLSAFSFATPGPFFGQTSLTLGSPTFSRLDNCSGANVVSLASPDVEYVGTDQGVCEFDGVNMADIATGLKTAVAVVGQDVGFASLSDVGRIVDDGSNTIDIEVALDTPLPSPVVIAPAGQSQFLLGSSVANQTEVLGTTPQGMGDTNALMIGMTWSQLSLGETFVRSFGGSAGDHATTTAVAVRLGGGWFAAGKYSGNLAFGSPCPTLSAPTGAMFVALLDPTTGDCVWAKSFGGGGETPRALAVTQGGLVLVGDSTSASLNLGGQNLTVPAPLFLLELDDTGAYKYSYAYGLGAHALATSMVPDASGTSVWIGGWFSDPQLTINDITFNGSMSGRKRGFLVQLAVP